MPVMFGSPEAAQIVKETKHAGRASRELPMIEKKRFKIAALEAAQADHRSARTRNSAPGPNWQKRDDRLSSQLLRLREDVPTLERGLVSTFGSLKRAAEVARLVK